MLKFKPVLWVAVLVAMMVTSGIAAADNTPHTETLPAQTALDATFEWPEAGLSFEYPTDWQQLNDDNADFLLVSPLQGESIVYVAMQSGLFDAEQETVEEIVGSFVDNPEELTVFTAGEGTAYQFTEVSDGFTSVFVGFTADDTQIHLMNLTTSDDIAADWLPVFDDIVASIVIEPLELDSELLNEQMQANYEATGRVIVGDLDAPIQAYEFLDFACPHCVDFHDSLNRLVQDQVVTGNANLQFGVLTFVAGELSVNAAAAQVCGASLGIGWDVHNILFKSYRYDGRAAYETDSILDNIEAAELPVERDEFAACMTDEEIVGDYLDLIGQDAGAFGVSSTPTMLFAAGDDLYALMTLSDGRTVSRANLAFTYVYMESLVE